MKLSVAGGHLLHGQVAPSGGALVKLGLRALFPGSGSLEEELWGPPKSQARSGARERQS